MYYEFVI